MIRFLKFCIIMFLLLGILAVFPCSSVTSAITPEMVLLQITDLIKVDKDVIYCTCDIPLTMDLYYPSHTDKPLPTIVYVHGGGWYSGDKETGTGKYDIAPLVKNGYLVAAINYRLAPRYKFPAQIEDVKCAVRFLRANADKYNIDINNIGAFGDSAGGHLVSLLGVTADSSVFGKCEVNSEQSDSVQAVVDIYGPADLTTNFEVYNSLFLETVFNTTEPDAEILEKGSPVSYVSDDAPPFLIIHGDKDDIVSPEQSQTLYNQLLSASVPASLLVVQNCGHVFAPTGGPIYPTRAEITDRIINFFDQYLKHE